MDGTASPCRRVCTLDAAGVLCTGCGRTLGEIAAWPGAGEAERAAIVARAVSRLLAVTGPPAADGPVPVRPVPP